MKDLLDAIYPRSDRSDYVVRLEPIQTTTKAVFQYLSTEDELARYPSRTTRSVISLMAISVSSCLTSSPIRRVLLFSVLEQVQ